MNAPERVWLDPIKRNDEMYALEYWRAYDKESCEESDIPYRRETECVWIPISTSQGPAYKRCKDRLVFRLNEIADESRTVGRWCPYCGGKIRVEDA